MKKNLHIPVLIGEIEKKLSSKKSQKIFDGTFGAGGYSEKFLQLGHQVWAFDKDSLAIELGKRELKTKKYKNFELSQKGFLDAIDDFSESFFDVIVLDLGFSSNQLEYSGRGFSYQKKDDPLDLRFDNRFGQPCWKRIQNLKNPELFFKIIYKYSGEKLSPRIAQAVISSVKNRKNSEVVKVGEVVDFITQTIPNKFKKNTNAILSRTWQALRIWVNDEFLELEKFLPRAIQKLSPGGRLMIVTFHSLEDKLVTHFMREIAKPEEIDVYGNTLENFKIIEKKGIKPTKEEIEDNIRSRSAILRILEKVDH